MIVEAVVLLHLQEHLAQRLELGDLLGEKALPGHVEFVRMTTVPGDVGLVLQLQKQQCLCFIQESILLRSWPNKYLTKS